jgi:hypothetical protein
MQDRPTIWRQIITRTQLELPQMRRSILQFFTFLPQGGQSHTTTDEDTEGNFVHKDLQECLKEIEETLQRLQTVLISLTSNMPLLDSQRSIAEAQNVTRLTELAFLFIPLTFAATLLGMQIDQFENRVPLLTFIILGISVTSFSYVVKLVIRSSWFRGIIEWSNESIKIYADQHRQPVQRGYVPTSLILRWLWQQFWIIIVSAFGLLLVSIGVVLFSPWKLASLFLSTFEFFVGPLMYIGLICVFPLALLWTRQLDHGIQVVFTVACLSTVSVQVFVSYWKSADPEVRGALPRILRKEFEHFKDGESVVYSWILGVGTMCIFLVPVIVLWTGPMDF